MAVYNNNRKIRAKKIDRKFCDRSMEAIRLLGNQKEVAGMAGLKPSQISDIGHYIIEPSKTLVRYLGDRGFSMDWLIAGRGPRYFAHKSMNGSSRQLFSAAITRDIKTLKCSFDGLKSELNKIFSMFD